MKICIVTGGSGGHIYPAITYADYVRDHFKDEICFIGNDHKMESKIVPKAGYDFYAIHNLGLQGNIISKLKAIFSQFRAYFQAKKHLQFLKPDVVFAFGGYVSGPVTFAAKNLGIPIVLHEQNAYPGKANKMIANSAKAIITCYKEAFSDLPQTHFLGNPRASLINESIDSTDELQRLNVERDKPIVLMVMGSQGSTAMNKKFMDFVNLYDDGSMTVIIVTGPLHINEFLNNVDNIHPNLRIVDFVDQKALLPCLDLIVCRSGASTVSEIQSFGIASLLIPSPYVANNHQYFNAKALYDVGACALMEETTINGLTLYNKIKELINNPDELSVIRRNAKAMATPNAVSEIAALVHAIGESYEKE